jgi:hypothetical protein
MSKGLMAATKGAGSGLANRRSSLVSRGNSVAFEDSTS